MPTVPRYESPQIMPNGVPSVRVNASAPASAFGGGEATQQLGNMASKMASNVYEIARKEKDKADDTAVQEAYARTVKLKNDLFYNPEKGVVTRTGKSAVGVIDDYRPQYEAGADEIESSLTNDDQKKQYRLIRYKQGTDFETDMQRHVFAETKKYEDETYKSTLDVTTEDAILHYRDPDAVRNAIYLQRATIVDYAQKNNKSAEWVKETLSEQVSKTQSSIINRMLANGDDMLAEKYFKENKELISGEHIIDLEKNLEEGTRRGKSQRAADNIVSRAGTMSEALEISNTINDPKLRDDTIERVKNHYADVATAQQRESDDLLAESLQVIQKDPRLEAIEPAKWNKMNAADQNVVIARLRQLREGIPNETDRATYYELAQMIAKDRAKFLKLNLMRYSPKLSDTDFKKFADMQKFATNGDSTKLDGFLSDKQAVDNVLAQAGLDPGAKPKTSMGKRVKHMYDLIDARVIEKQKDTGRKLNNDEIRDIANELALEVTVKRDWWFDEQKLLGEIGADDEIVGVKVPPNEAAIIEQELRARGKKVSDDEIAKWYLRGLKR